MIPTLVPRRTLIDALAPAAVEALEEMLAEVAADAGRLGPLFSAAARRTSRGTLSGYAVTIGDAVRVELIAAAALTAGALLAELRELYRYGDNDEKRSVILALNGTDDTVDGSDLLADALRTNDTRLVAAAMGAHATRLPDDAWRHGVLKCLFTGVPVVAVAGLAVRADDELAAMVLRYAAEREAAGRAVPADVATVLDACPTATPTPTGV